MNVDGDTRPINTFAVTGANPTTAPVNIIPILRDSRVAASAPM